MKYTLAAMAAMFALIVWPLGWVWQLLSGIMGGGVSESFLYPIYGGFILLSGLIVFCTNRILDEVRSLRDEIKGKDENKDGEP